MERVKVTSRGKVTARIVPERDESEAARRRLLQARKRCCIGDIVSPSGEAWNAKQSKISPQRPR